MKAQRKPLEADAVKARPIIFSPASVHAIIEGRKTETRRVIGERERVGYPMNEIASATGARFGTTGGLTFLWRCPYGAPGSLLWVREPYASDSAEFDAPRAEWEGPPPCEPYYRDPVHENTGLRWRNPMFMPRWASRLTLRINEIYAERLHEITEDGARAEGAPLMRCIRGSWGGWGSGEPPPLSGYNHRDGYRYGWDRLNAKRGYPWESNPWVWVVRFTVAACYAEVAYD